MTNASRRQWGVPMFSKELVARIKEVLASNPRDMTPEERRSLFSDELVLQIRNAVASSTRAMPPEQVRNDLRSLCARLLNSLETKQDLQSEKMELEVLEQRLRVLEENPKAQDVRRLSTEFYTLVESNPNLRSVYMAVTEEEIQELLSQKLESHGPEKTAIGETGNSNGRIPSTDRPGTA